MSDELHALAFLAGANSIFSGENLLTTGNAGDARDRDLLARLGLHARSQPAPVQTSARTPSPAPPAAPGAAAAAAAR